MNVQTLLDSAKTHQGIKSDYALAKAVGVTHPAVKRWRDGNGFPSPEHAYTLAKMAGLDPAEVIATVLAQSEKNPDVKKVFEHLQKCVAAAACLVLAVWQCILC